MRFFYPRTDSRETIQFQTQSDVVMIERVTSLLTINDIEKINQIMFNEEIVLNSLSLPSPIFPLCFNIKLHHTTFEDSVAEKGNVS